MLSSTAHVVTGSHVMGEGLIVFDSRLTRPSALVQVSLASISATHGDVQPVLDFLGRCVPP